MLDRVSRAAFLRLSAITAVSAIVTACSQQSASTATAPTTTAAASSTSVATTESSTTTSASAATTSATASNAAAASIGTSTSVASSAAATATIGTVSGTTYTGAYQEAPMLAALVKAGSLPPLAQRLPEHPYVVPHSWLTSGQYGGQMQWVCNDTSDWGTTHYIQESMYGHSPLRWLNDGLALGPGLAESWVANADQTVWTYHFRKGLKWSDGQPWTVDDVIFWWEDEQHNAQLNPSGAAPIELKSGKGTPATMKKVDDTTLELHYDSPTPLSADFSATWVKRGIGPQWMDCKHYMQQFHLKYNSSLDKTKWVTNFQAKQDWATNPANPTMTGWRLKSYTQGQNSVWERNPYYWCIDKAGHQLPYVDGITQTNFQDPQVMRLQIQQGKADFVHGGFTGLNLSDVASIAATKTQNKLNVVLWDSGSGTASIFFFNYDYHEANMRKLIREPKFRQALSHAFNRAKARKTIYYETGEATTGTMSPKSVEYHVGTGAQTYAQWRDSYVEYNPDKAKQMLDALGVKQNGQWRTMPDGSPLEVILNYSASQNPTGEHVKKDDQLAADWQAIGINTKLNPVTPTSVNTFWQNGQSMSKTDWEASDGPNSLINPTWLVPMEPSRWAPLEGTYYSLRGTPSEHNQDNIDPYQRTPPRMAPDPGGPVEKLWQLYDQAALEPTFLGRTKLVWEIMKVHITDGPFFQGTVADYPQIELVREDLKNVPTRDQLPQHGYVNTWAYPVLAAYDMETWYFTDPSAHS
jgi:peptide/nickel transport system substrate-binding protein